MGLLSFFKNSSNNIWSTIKSFFISTSNFDELLTKLEEMLYLGDVGVETTEKLIKNLNDYIKKNPNSNNKALINIFISLFNYSRK